MKGLMAREGVALAGRPTIPGALFSNQFFIDLKTKTIDFTEEELALLEEEFADIVDEYAADQEAFETEFKAAWTKMMIADRFDGPFKNACDGISHATLFVEDIDHDFNATESGAPSLTFLSGLMCIVAVVPAFLY